jgi:hypothetical protein
MGVKSVLIVSFFLAIDGSVGVGCLPEALLTYQAMFVAQVLFIESHARGCSQTS